MVSSREEVLASVVKQVKEYHAKTGVWLWNIATEIHDDAKAFAGFTATSTYDFTWDEIKAAVNA